VLSGDRNATMILLAGSLEIDCSSPALRRIPSGNRVIHMRKMPFNPQALLIKTGHDKTTLPLPTHWP
jgi:hypothetical protein